MDEIFFEIFINKFFLYKPLDPEFIRKYFLQDKITKRGYDIKKLSRKTGRAILNIHGCSFYSLYFTFPMFSTVIHHGL